MTKESIESETVVQKTTEHKIASIKYYTFELDSKIFKHYFIHNASWELHEILECFLLYIIT